MPEHPRESTVRGYRYVHAHPARGWVSFRRDGELAHVTTKDWCLWLRARLAAALQRSRDTPNGAS